MGRAGDQSFWGIGVPSIFGNMSEQPATGEANASAAVFGGGNRRGDGTGWWWHTPFDTLDKMDEQILVRDTRIYLQVVWRLLTDAVLPFDYAEHAAYLADELRSLQGAAGDRFDLSLLGSRADALRTKAEQLNRAIAAGLDARRAGIANETLDSGRACAGAGRLLDRRSLRPGSGARPAGLSGAAAAARPGGASARLGSGAVPRGRHAPCAQSGRVRAARGAGGDRSWTGAASRLNKE